MVAKRTKLHILALVSLVTALAFLILLSVSKMTDVNHSFLGLGVATFNGASPTKLVDGKHGQTVGENLANIRYGLWYYCWGVPSPGYDFRCINPGLGYSQTIVRTDDFPVSFTISSGLTRAFVLHPIAAVLVFLTLVAVLHKRAIDHAHAVVIATISLLTVLATFAVDIAFMVTVQKGLRKNASLNGYLAFDAGFFLMIIPTVAIIVAWIAIHANYFGLRYSKVAGLPTYAEYPGSTVVDKNVSTVYGPWWRRFKWANGNNVSSEAVAPETVERSK